MLLLSLSVSLYSQNHVVLALYILTLLQYGTCIIQAGLRGALAHLTFVCLRRKKGHYMLKVDMWLVFRFLGCCNLAWQNAFQN